MDFLEKIFNTLKTNWIFSFLYGPRRFDQVIKEIKKIKPKRIMEIGTWDGEFALKMIETAQAVVDEVYYYGFDFFDEIDKKNPSQLVVTEKLSKTGARIHLFQGDSAKTLLRVRKELPTMDFIFVNGGDSLEAVRSDWEQVEKIMNYQTVVIFDHYWDRDDIGAKSLVNSLDINQYRVEVLPEQDGFWIESDWSRINLVKITKNKV